MKCSIMLHFIQVYTACKGKQANSLTFFRQEQAGPLTYFGTFAKHFLYS